MSQSPDSEKQESPEPAAASKSDAEASTDVDRSPCWLAEELGTRRAGGNQRRAKVGVFRWCKRLVVGTVLLGLAIGIGLGVAAWYSRAWLRKEGERHLMAELAERRIYLDYESATYEFTRGLVLRGVTLYETETRVNRLLTCTEMGFSFDAVGLLQSRLTGGLTTSFRTRGATMVCYEDGEILATIENLTTDVMGRPDDVLIDRISGRTGDLNFEIEGQILATREKRRQNKEKDLLAAQSGKPRIRKVVDFAFLKDLLPWLEVTSRKEGVYPELRAKIVIDHSAPAPVTVSGRFSGREFKWKNVPMDSAAVDFSFAEGDERLVLPGFNLIYKGGLITGTGVWDSGTNTAQVERFQSAAHLVGLLRDINPNIAPAAATIVQDEPPLISAKGSLKLKDFWSSDLAVTYRHQSGMTVTVGGRPLRIEGINGQLQVGSGGFQTESLRATLLGGTFDFAGSADLNGEEPAYRGSLNVRGLPLQALVDHFGGKHEMPGILSGRFEGGGGNSLAQLNGQGSVRVDAAKLYKVPIVGPVQNIMGSVVPVFGDSEKRSELTATFSVADGLLDTRDLVILADGTRVEVGGTVNLTDWQTRFEARGNLVGALGLVTGLLSHALVVEGSGRVDNLDLKLKSVPAEFASETVKGIFGVAKGGVDMVTGTVGAGFEGAQEVAGGAIKATGNVLNGGANAVTDGVRAVGGGLEDGARKVGQGAKKLGEGLMKIIPGVGGRDHDGKGTERPSPPDTSSKTDPEPPKLKPAPGQAAPTFRD